MDDLIERIVQAAENAMGSQVAIDLDEHRDVAAAVLRVLDEEIGNANENGDDWPDLGDLALLADGIERRGATNA